ncbi:unnamed protein product [Protopolystoma xenopodis]|uniref:Uncharacterized protein n=1 Tax=Protopolystoma xenopodis TaxID=117903 RepID=A0A3S5CIZ8_9PLAT|nr:unnamed protein product [Protopolystoma xenopodis]
MIVLSLTYADISLQDCLPSLLKCLRDDHGLWSSEPVANTFLAQASRLETSFFNSRSRGIVPPSQLYLVEALPQAYSGLVLIATSWRYSIAALKYYKKASLTKVTSS